MKDRIPVIIDEINVRRLSAMKKFEKFEDEHEFISELIPGSGFQNRMILKNLKCLEEAIKTDEKIVLCERQLYNSYIELLSYIPDEERYEFRNKMLKAEIENLGIVTGYTEEGWVYVRTPGFLPTESDAWLSKDFFNPIEQSLSRLNPEKRFFDGRCFIATIQNIEKGTKRQVIDADNREYRNLNNMLARNFLWDDNPVFCDFLLGSLFKETSYVEAFVIPTKDMPEFLSRLENEEITPKKLLDSRPAKNKV